MKAAPEILMDLVSIPSVSSMGNTPVIEYALRYLDRQKWTIVRHSYRDSAGIEKVNLVASAKGKDGQESELALVSHTDTVPFDPTWAEAVHPVLREGRIFGRGSCDVKGFLACALEAVSRVDVSQLSRPLALILTADEEVGCVGAKFLIDMRAFKSRYMIIGEPTGLAPVSAGKGYALAEIVVRGEEAHSAFPARGHSAIRDAARVLERLDDVGSQLASRMDARFDPPFTTLNVGLISGGRAKNIVPGECRMTVEWRPIPGQEIDLAASLIRDELSALRNEVRGFDAELEVKRADPAFGTTGPNGLALLLESLTNRPSGTVAFGTEAAHLSVLTSEAVVFGPGDMAVAHKTGEFVRIGEMRDCVNYLVSAIERLCGRESK